MSEYREDLVEVLLYGFLEAGYSEAVKALVAYNPQVYDMSTKNFGRWGPSVASAGIAMVIRLLANEPPYSKYANRLIEGAVFTFLSEATKVLKGYGWCRVDIENRVVDCGSDEVKYLFADTDVVVGQPKKSPIQFADYATQFARYVAIGSKVYLFEAPYKIRVQ